MDNAVKIYLGLICIGLNTRLHLYCKFVEGFKKSHTQKTDDLPVFARFWNATSRGTDMGIK